LQDLKVWTQYGNNPLVLYGLHHLTRPFLQDAGRGVWHLAFSAKADCAHNIFHAVGDSCASSLDWLPAILREPLFDCPGNQDLWPFSASASAAF
jgi:hypothetical protein